MMRNESIPKFLIAVSIPVIILLSMTVFPLISYFFGEEILLETEPYDPRDIFRGDHVILNYKINNINIDKLPGEVKKDYKKYRNKKAYAVLKKTGTYYDVDYISIEKPKDGIFLSCKLPRYYSFNPYLPDTEKIVRVYYNLDKFFVPENTGSVLEDMSRKGQLIARVRVYNGYPLLTNVFKIETAE